MIRIAFISVGLLLFVASKAQQLPQDNLHQVNSILTNPATTGSAQTTEIIASFRTQYIGLNDYPITGALTANAGFKSMNIGLGGFLLYDQTGPTRTAEIGVSAAYNFYIDPIDKEDLRYNEFNELQYRRVSLGLSASIAQFGLDGEQLRLNDANDQAIAESLEKKLFPNAAFGIFYSSPKTRVGLSVPQVLQYNVSLDDANRADIKKLQHYYISFIQSIYIKGSSMRLQPWARFKYTTFVPAQLEAGLKFAVSEIGWLGFAYRTKKQLLFEGGIHLRNGLLIGYAYDLPIVDYRNLLGQSHEVAIGYRFNRK